MGVSQSGNRFEDAFSDEEASGYGGSPTRHSYRPQSLSGHASPGGDLSDEELCAAGISTTTATNNNTGPPGLESLCITGGHMEFPQSYQQQCARSRSGSCASRRSQFR